MATVDNEMCIFNTTAPCNNRRKRDAFSCESEPICPKTGRVKGKRNLGFSFASEQRTPDAKAIEDFVFEGKAAAYRNFMSNLWASRRGR